MYLRSQKETMQSVADRVKMNPRAAAKEANEVLVVKTVSEQKEKLVVKKQVQEPVYHRYMLRSMRR